MSKNIPTIIKKCNNRQDLGWKNVDTEEPIYICNQINNKLGWRHGVGAGCCGGCSGEETISSVVKATLKFALRDWKSSAELYERIYKGNRRHVVNKCLKEGISIDDILINLALGVARGVPREEIIKIAQEFKFFEKEEE